MFAAALTETNSEHDGERPSLQQEFERLQEDLATKQLPSQMSEKNFFALQPIDCSSSLLNIIDPPQSKKSLRTPLTNLSLSSSNKRAKIANWFSSDVENRQPLLDEEMASVLDFNITPIEKRYRVGTCFEAIRSFDHALVFRAMIIFVLWLGSAIIFYSYHDGFRWWQAFYYAVQAGFSVGFGALTEGNDLSRLFTIFVTLCGSSLIVSGISFILKKGMGNLNLYRRSVEACFTAADKDGTGELTLCEFHAFLLGNGYLVSTREAKKLFKKIDIHKTGAITKSEWLEYYNNYGGRGSFAKQFYTFLDSWMMTFVFFMWTAIGAAYGVFYEKWSIITGFYYSVTACSTGGLMAPSNTKTGLLFTGFFCLIGIPLYAIALSEIANFIVDRMLRSQAKEACMDASYKVTFNYADYIRHLGPEKNLDWPHFLQLELIRLGRIDKELLDKLRLRFNTLDTANKGVLDSRNIKVVIEGNCNGKLEDEMNFQNLSRMASLKWRSPRQLLPILEENAAGNRFSNTSAPS